MPVKFCRPHCDHLSLKEKDQSNLIKNYYYWCDRYDRQIKHLGNRPYLVACGGCDCSLNKEDLY